MTDKPRKKRRSREEILAETLAKAEKLKAQIAGTYTADSETIVGKRLRNALRKRKTVLHRANVLVSGRAATEKSPAMNGIDEKIANAEKRLADLIESRERAVEQIANLPFDIEKLAQLVEAEEKGQEVDFPTNLYRLPGEGEQTDTEAEVAAGTSDDAEVS